MGLVIEDACMTTSDRLNLKPVLVVWEDASHGSGWMEGEEVESSETMVETVGWLAVMTEQHMIIVQSVTEGGHAQSLQVPAGMVRSVTFLLSE